MAGAKLLIKFFALMILVANNNIVNAATEKIDFLAGVGSFEYCGDTGWVAGYSGSGYNYSQQSGWTSKPDSEGWRSGFDPAEADDSVAVGWLRRTGTLVNPGKNIIYRIVKDGGINHSNCQYMALKAITSGFNSAEISALCSTGSSISNIHKGDVLTFRVDSIRMSNYDNLPPKTTVTYKLVVETGAQTFSQRLNPSSTAFAGEVSTLAIDGNAKFVTASVRIEVNGNLLDKQPGIYLDGAHVYVKRADNPNVHDTWEVPARSAGSPSRTLACFNWSNSLYDVYDVAANYNIVILSECDGSTVAALKYLNPSIKVYVYESMLVSDGRDSQGIDAWYSNSPFQLNWTMSNHPEWMYKDEKGEYINDPSYPASYYLRLTLTDVQNAWANAVKSIALRWHFDGIFIDCLEPLSKTSQSGTLVIPERNPWELQSFLRAVMPVMQGSRLTIMHNVCGYNIGSLPGSIYMNPSWVPIAPYNTSQYSANTSATVADVMFQEWAFFTIFQQHNNYNREYWMKCLNDMDSIQSWNWANASSGFKKYYVINIYGIHDTDLPADGINGWLQFGLCSYLLGANDWTSLAYGVKNNSKAAIDFAKVKRLGTPSGQNVANVGDPYCRWRRYKATESGGLGGVVVVNANTTVTRTYTIDFDATDENGNPVAGGTKIKILPNTGRLFIQRQLLNVQLSVSSESVSSGQTVEVTVKYTNKSSSLVNNVIVSVIVPDQMRYLAGSAEKSKGRYYSDTNTVIWTISSLPGNGTGSRTFRAVVK